MTEIHKMCGNARKRQLMRPKEIFWVAVVDVRYARHVCRPHLDAHLPHHGRFSRSKSNWWLLLICNCCWWFKAAAAACGTDEPKPRREYTAGLRLTLPGAGGKYKRFCIVSRRSRVERGKQQFLYKLRWGSIVDPRSMDPRRRPMAAAASQQVPGGAAD